MSYISLHLGDCPFYKTLLETLTAGDAVRKRMGRSRRKYKNSRPKVRCGLPKKNPGVFKPAFSIPKELLAGGDEAAERKWDEKGSVIQNYRRFGVVPNPNLLGVRSRTPQVLLCDSLQLPYQNGGIQISEFDPVDGGSDVETDGA